MQVFGTNKARKRDQAYISAGLDLTDLTEGNVMNGDGHLINLAGNEPQKGYVPGGSYLKSVQNIQVVLSALCVMEDGRTQWSTLDITDAPANSTVSNLNGNLQLDH